MKKNLILLLAVVMTFVGCKLLSGPEIPEKQDDVVELKYVRDLSIINPSGSDPRGLAISNAEFGGISLNWSDPNVWQVETSLRYSNRPYHPYTIDKKVTSDYAGIATTIYVRVKGTASWTKIAVGPNGEIAGEWGTFNLDRSGISTPSQTN